jgi:hypothetical protein
MRRLSLLSLLDLMSSTSAKRLSLLSLLDLMSSTSAKRLLLGLLLWWWVQVLWSALRILWWLWAGIRSWDCYIDTPLKLAGHYIVFHHH